MYLILLISFSLMLQGCILDNAPSDKILKQLFNKDKAQFYELNSLCLNYKNLEFIDIQKNEVRFENKESEQIKNKILKQAKNFSSKPTFDHIRCLKSYKKGKGKLIAIRYTFFSTGISVSGSLKGIEYVLQLDGLDNYFKTGILRKINNENNWFIYDSEGNK